MMQSKTESQPCVGQFDTKSVMILQFAVTQSDIHLFQRKNLPKIEKKILVYQKFMKVNLLG